MARERVLQVKGNLRLKPHSFSTCCNFDEEDPKLHEDIKEENICELEISE